MQGLVLESVFSKKQFKFGWFAALCEVIAFSMLAGIFQFRC
jgi:hypothetical protein